MEKVLECVPLIVIILLGICFLYRAIRPYYNKHTIRNKDIEDIKSSWNAISEEPITIDFIYDKSCQYERVRTYTKIFLFCCGIFFTIIGLLELVKILR